jgi:hypothetical protein
LLFMFDGVGVERHFGGARPADLMTWPLGRIHSSHVRHACMDGNEIGAGTAALGMRTICTSRSLGDEDCEFSGGFQGLG